MKSSLVRTVITIWVVIGLAILVLVLFQSVWMKLISDAINSGQSSDLPVSTTPITNFSFSQGNDPVPAGVESVVGNLGITLIRAVFQANYLGTSSKYSQINANQEYILVQIKVHCVSPTETCHVTEFDFGVHSASGGDYPAELSMNYDTTGLFEGGDIKPNNVISGSIIFVVAKGDRGLTLEYPRMFAFGNNSARFSLGR